MRPKTFNEFVGKANIKDQLQTFIKSSLLKNQTLPHTLFYGPPGVGKTSLAMIIANEINAKLKILQAPNIQKVSDLLNVFSLVNKNDILFIDEIHALEPKMMEFMFTAMEDFCIDLIIGKEFNSKITRMKIPKFTLIGATTQFGKILSPLEERFGIVINVDYYSIDEMKQLIKSKIKDTNLELNDDEVTLIASHSRFIPRLAIRLVNRVHDYKTINPNLPLTEILQQLNIYQDGLTNQDFRYLKALKRKESTGIKSLSIITGMDPVTIETKIEPFLLKLNLIQKTPRGRLITDKGHSYLSNHHS